MEYCNSKKDLNLRAEQAKMDALTTQRLAQVCRKIIFKMLYLGY